MTDLLLNLEFHKDRSRQQQIREKLVELITKDTFGEKPLPSGRKMAKQLGVSRNTVILVYESLVDEGYLIAKERSGFFVNQEIAHQNTPKPAQTEADTTCNRANWQKRIQSPPSVLRTLEKDKTWMSYQYPFIYGQIQPDQFPLYQWRDCSRHAHGKNDLKNWVEDYIDADDAELVAQIRQQVLTKRGVSASDEEVLITLGTQNSMYMLASLFCHSKIRLGVENPGYADIRHIFRQEGAEICALELDQNGLKTGQQLAGCDYVFVTPSHQYPTTVTMSLERRKDLLKQADQNDFVIIEDDYESEVNFLSQPLPALKSMDHSGRVIYTGSLSKSLSPGLRIGYIVADKSLIKELRALRRLMYRHPPANNQRTMAMFLSQGYYDSHIRRMQKIYEEKWHQMAEGLNEYLPNCTVRTTPGSFCFWVKLPDGVSSKTVIEEAAKKSILVEAGDSLFAGTNKPQSYIRLGFSAIPEQQIDPGLKTLGDLVFAMEDLA